MRRPRFTIATRIFLAFAGVLMAFGTVSAASLLQHQRTSETLRLLDEAYVPLTFAIAEAKATEAIAQNMGEYLLDDPRRTRVWLATRDVVIPREIARARAAIARAMQLDPPEVDRGTLTEIDAELDRVQSGYESTARLYAELFAALDRNERSHAAQILGTVTSVEGRIARSLLRARNRVRQRIEQTSRLAAERQRQAVVEVAVLALLALAAGLGVTWWSQRLLAPLTRLKERVVAVARGDLGARLEVRRDDEIGLLAEEFERMVDAIAARDEALRELQRLQERIVASLRSAVVVVDGARRVRAANAAAAQVLGIGREALERPLAATGLLARIAGLEDTIAQVAASGVAVTLRAATLAGHDGAGPRHVDVLVAPFGTDPATPAETDLDGRPALRRSVLLVADDVTEELATKARLIQTERLAAVGKMAALVTHEVRNPLSSIGLNVDVLAEELAHAGPSVEAPLRAIQREVDRLTAITEEYLRLARLPAPRLEREDLGTLVSDAARFVEHEMRQAGCELETVIEPDLPLALADEAQIRGALLNLLRNAREAMPRGGKITLSARAREGGVEIAVRDRGEGISPERKARIFELFFSTKERGTGLGLPLTQQIVLAHRGRIWCEDAPGGGTVFVMWIPAAPPPDEAVCEHWASGGAGTDRAQQTVIDAPMEQRG